MKIRYYIVVSAILMAFCGHGQGLFQFSNVFAPTRLWTLDGPLAGRGIWAQMLAGPALDSLAPVGRAREHQTNGLVYGGIVTVPGIPEFEAAYIQMVAWDGRLWGTNLADVPPIQLGSTDVAVHVLGGSILPISAPRFTQPAIVPVPEPSVPGLALLAGAAVFVWRRRWGRARHPE